MDYNHILSELQQASTFELFRLKAAISTLLDEPARLAAIKRNLKPGMEITYFHEVGNRLVTARVLQIRNTRATVQDLDTGKRWNTALYTINLQGVDTDIQARRNGVDRLSLRIGDRVGFTGRDGQELFGTVVKLNPKRAKVKTESGIWTVPYSMLFTVIEGERGGDQTLLSGS
jgi:hypothetical protein